MVDCAIENIVTTSTSIKTNASNPSQSKVTVTLSYTVVVDYADVNGNIFTISEESVTKRPKSGGKPQKHDAAFWSGLPGSQAAR